MKSKLLIAVAGAFAAATVMQTTVLVAPVHADDNTNVWTCRGFSAPTQEPLGDREGHMPWQREWNCLVQSGPLVGGVATGDVAWEPTSACGAPLWMKWVSPSLT